jgi:hypothetical protein
VAVHRTSGSGSCSSAYRSVEKTLCPEPGQNLPCSRPNLLNMNNRRAHLADVRNKRPETLAPTTLVLILFRKHQSITVAQGLALKAFPGFPPLSGQPGSHRDHQIPVWAAVVSYAMPMRTASGKPTASLPHAFYPMERRTATAQPPTGRGEQGVGLNLSFGRRQPTT